MSGDVGVASSRAEDLPAGVKGEEEEDDEHDAEYGQDQDPHCQVHRLEGSHCVVGAVWDVCGLLHQVTHGPTNTRLLVHLQEQSRVQKLSLSVL